MYIICIGLIYLYFRIRQMTIAYKEDDTYSFLIIFMPILFWIFFISGLWTLNLFFLIIMILTTLFFTITPIFTFSIFGKYWGKHHMKNVLSVDVELICFIIPSMLFGSIEGGGIMVSSSLNYDVYFLIFKLFELR